ncbi:PIG-L family deacetylase [Galbibacter pacificus]|uniref:PIG-L family deacetylase n=1 Tax=Galbibacter pacificus TaxID=2996052 RepID=A0ABT6FQW3_9FLAO|nr:PIG-L family deacetylase [Galbibacter pacificus]MDG3581863.1 PIG-L family deacetylase [Galbibacter pacificus]MDG3585663.1 PIG-L family deacetylase [Galbibacter pacificus]
MQRILSFLIGLAITFSINAQKPKTYTSSNIYEAVQKLNFLGTALYIAAHPDDENTRLISYLSNEVKARTAYLSLTRGDGGQNLIGPELRELLGVLRTEELLAARNIDGGQQFFSRANDFGFSKHPEETLEIWNKKEVLADVVWVIRNFKPDVIINRFDHRTPGTTHGHHTSSAMLSFEAFDMAGNPNEYPEQLKYTATWQPERLFFNTSWWFYGSPENFEKANKTKLLHVDIGTYYPTLGMSNNEIASIARSQHLSQGFGGISSRGSEQEYLEYLKGSFPNDENNIFSGINTTWGRVKGGEAIAEILLDVQNHFNFKNPSEHVPQLVKAYQLINNLEDEYWRKVKLEEIKKIIKACSGLFLEATVNQASAVPGETIDVRASTINRSDIEMKLKSIKTTPTNETNNYNKTLANNQETSSGIAVTIPQNGPYTAPYWLKEEGTLGMYKAPQELRGKPETPRLVKAYFNIDIGGVEIPFEEDIVYKYSKPDKGEIYQPFQILPPVTASVANKVAIFSNNESKQISVTITAGKDNISGPLHLKHNGGWNVSPESINFNIANKGDTKTIHFKITPPDNEDEETMTPVIKVNGKDYNKALVTIAYDHIPTQSVLLPDSFKVVRLNIKKVGENIAYIAGAGDAVPESLRQIGYNVTVIQPENINSAYLKNFDAVVVGIRAYNIHESLKFKQPILLDYVKNGGNLVVQYNTAGRGGLNIDNLAPYLLELSRDRVTDENAEVTFNAPSNALLNTPNKITQNDFNGWVQERGLYFPDKWGKEFTSVLSMHDKGESKKDGSLLIAPYGKGYYIYTGLSFFRELPAGVPGAYKIFANMLSVGKTAKNDANYIKG